MTARMYYDVDADPAALEGRRIAVLGYGSQGHAHALNLRRLGSRRPRRPPRGQPESSRRPKPRACGCSPVPRRAPRPTSSWSSPRTRRSASSTRRRSRRTCSPGKMLMFAHGFNIHFAQHHAARGRRRQHDRPQGPRSPRAQTYVSGQGVPASSPSTRTRRARRASGRSRTRAGIGAARAGVLETTFAEETETDLFGEQAVLCGGVSVARQGRASRR